ncbi:hypothetical protein ZIOFF_014397 [Zingiber officinale]|uniref:Uncharacterized protein n=1 Tax=Zingiber officinale TaxID=94328 RepID=A0A8J5HH95_ZINOF|nr:hypothetical protein ZIOFF_014397 [Zingiber officinale]
MALTASTSTEERRKASASVIRAQCGDGRLCPVRRRRSAKKEGVGGVAQIHGTAVDARSRARLGGGEVFILVTRLPRDDEHELPRIGGSGTPIIFWNVEGCLLSSPNEIIIIAINSLALLQSIYRAFSASKLVREVFDPISQRVRSLDSPSIPDPRAEFSDFVASQASVAGELPTLSPIKTVATGDGGGGEEGCITPKSEEYTLKLPAVYPPAPRKPKVARRTSPSAVSATDSKKFCAVPRDLTSVFLSLPSKKRIRTSTELIFAAVIFLVGSFHMVDPESALQFSLGSKTAKFMRRILQTTDMN